MFYLLLCDRCGRKKPIPGDRRGSGDPGIPYEQVEKAIEKKAGKCRCGGKFKLDAKPRCPKCRSTKFEVDDRTLIMYD